MLPFTASRGGSRPIFILCPPTSGGIVSPTTTTATGPFAGLNARTLLSLLVIEDIADVLGEVASIDVLVGLRGGLGVFVPEGALGRSGAALAVENVADAAARAVGLEIIDWTVGIDPRLVAQVTENPAYTPGGEIRRHDFVLAQEGFDIVVFEEDFDLFDRNALLGEVLAYEAVEGRRVCSRKNRPVLGRRVLDSSVAVKATSGLACFPSKSTPGGAISMSTSARSSVLERP
jgi:hypothetical protein